MDCEGEEFDIIKNLDEDNLIDSFKLIMLEWHYRSCEVLVKTLTGRGFSVIVNKNPHEENMGMIYGWK